MAFGAPAIPKEKLNKPVANSKSRVKHMAEEKKEKDMSQEYELLAKKYGLPGYNDIDREFPLGHLEPGNFVLRSVCLKMAERCDYTRKLLGDFIQPDTHIADMQEAESITDSDKAKVLELFKKLSFYSREFVIVDFDYDEKRSADLIREFYSVWEGIKGDVVQIVARVRDSWKKSLSRKQDYNYFG